MRLKNSGYPVDKWENIEYTKDDTRKFSILLDNGGACIFITCYKDGKIQFYDGGRNHITHLPHKTDSVEVIYEYLNDKGVINKHRSYLERVQRYNVDGTPIIYEEKTTPDIK